MIDPSLTRLLLDAAIWSVIVSGFGLAATGVMCTAQLVRETNQRHRVHQQWMAQMQEDIAVDDADALSDELGPQEAGDIAMSSLHSDPANYHDHIMPEQIRRHPMIAEKLKAIAEDLAADGREISSDDIHAEFERRHDGMKLADMPGVDARIMAVAFENKKGKWIKCGWQASERRDCHYRPVRRWKLRNPPMGADVTAA